MLTVASLNWDLPMHQILPIPHWISRVCGMLSAIFVSTIGVADETPGPTRSWSLRDEFQTGPAGGNPMADERGEAVWYMLRTTSSDGPVESRKWLRDGRYVPLGDAGDKLFGSPLDGWAYRAKNPLAQVPIPDFHATILHTLSLNHERLAFRHAGRDHCLTDVYGHVVREIVA